MTEEEAVTRFLYLFCSLTLALAITSCAAVPRGQSSDRINGLVTSMVDGEEKPVSTATVRLSVPGDENLLGVATTTFAGTFSVDRLSNRLTEQDAQLLRNQEYVVEVQAPEHYLMKQRFTFEKGVEDWTFIMILKTADLGSDDSLLPPTGEGNGLTFGGAVRKGK